MRIVEELKRIEWEHLDEGCDNLTDLYLVSQWDKEEKNNICKLIESNDIEGLSKVLNGKFKSDNPDIDLEEGIGDLFKGKYHYYCVVYNKDNRKVLDKVYGSPEEAMKMAKRLASAGSVNGERIGFVNVSDGKKTLKRIDVNESVEEEFHEECEAQRKMEESEFDFNKAVGEMDVGDDIMYDGKNFHKDEDGMVRVKEEFSFEDEGEDLELLSDLEAIEESDAQRDEIRDQAKIKTEIRHENEEEEFERIKDKLGEGFDLYEDYGEESDNVYKILEEVSSFVRDFDPENYEDEIGDEDGIEFAYYNLRNKGPHGLRADLDQLTQDARETEDEEEAAYWDKYYAESYNRIIEALDNFYDNPNTPVGEFLDEGKERRIADYRKYAGLTEDMKITEDMIDDYALNKVACLNYRSKDDIKAELLGQE